MNRLILLAAASATLLLNSPRALAETLTLRDAVELALQNQPSLSSAKIRIEAAELDVEAVELSTNPTLALSGSVATGASQPPSLLEPTWRVGANLIGSWRLYDFGKQAAQRTAAQAQATAVRASLTQAERALLTQVELAYADVIGAASQAEVAATTTAAEARHLDEAERFVKAEVRTAIDVAQAKARFAKAQVAEVRAQNAIAIARASLERAIGMELGADVELTTTWPEAMAGEDAPVAALIDEAINQDPDLAALAAQANAAVASRDSVRTSLRPTLSASASAGLGTGGLYNEAPSGSVDWSAGLSLSWQLYDGGSRDIQLRDAALSIRSVDASRDARLIELRYNITAARISIDGAKAQQRALVASTEAASEQLRLAEARFSAGLGTATELADAQDALTTARGDVTDAAYQLAVARATLRNLLGRPPA